MQKDKILEVASELLAALRGGVSRGEAAVARELDCTKTYSSRNEKISHLVFLCEEIPRLIGQEKIELAKEYIDFVQGALWVMLPISLRAFRLMKMA
jgi:hypothetical protein